MHSTHPTPSTDVDGVYDQLDDVALKALVKQTQAEADAAQRACRATRHREALSPAAMRRRREASDLQREADRMRKELKRRKKTRHD